MVNLKVSYVFISCLMRFLTPIYGLEIQSTYNDRREMCPKLCKCSMLEGRPMADCSYANLINTYTDVPEAVEILDLSNNKITSIDDHCLKKYEKIVKLYLAKNAIDTIYLDAFTNMRSITHLDLSDNRLEGFDDRLFQTNNKLIDLNLSGNKFMTIQDKPILYSRSILFLDLSRSQIPHIYPSIFNGLSNLKSLDLSNNLLINLKSEPFSNLSKLEFLNIEENVWKCGDSLKELLGWFRKKVIKVEIEKCFLSTTKTTSKFEKMELDPHFVPEYQNSEDIEIDKVWNTTNRQNDINGYWYSVLDKNCDLHDGLENDKTCEDFLVCQHKYKELITILKDLVQNNFAKSMEHISLALVLYSGLFVGLVIGMCSMYLICIVREKCYGFNERNSREQQMRREFRERNNFMHSRFIDSPQLPRRETQRPIIPENPRYEQIVHYRNNENTREFLERLFGKRQPRYLRNNSQMTNLANRSQITRLTAPTEDQVCPILRPRTNSIGSNGIHEVLVEESSYSRASSFPELIQLNVESNDNIDLEESRPVLRDSYTPPPPYKDCVVRLSTLKANEN